MPKFSAFTPMGLFRLTRDPSMARTIYDAEVRALGAATGKDPAYATAEPGSRLHAKIYAQSIRRAVTRMLLRRASECDLPSKVHPSMIPIREIEYGIAPPQGSLMIQRRRALVAAYRLPLGGSRYNVEQVMVALLGSGFQYYRCFDPATDTRVLYPAAIGDSPMSLKRPNAARVVVSLIGVPGPDNDVIPGISMPSTAPQLCYYSAVIPKGAANPILYGDEELVIEPSNPARCERVSVVETGTDAFGNWFKAAFGQAHEPGCLASSGPFPFWASNQRYSLIVVTPAVAADPNLVRQVHVVMRQLARGVSTWAVVESSSTTTAGPFKVEVSGIGFVPLGTVAFPFLPPTGP